MRITIKTGASPNETIFTLSGIGAEGQSGLTVSDDSEVQIATYLRSTIAKPINRGNLRTRLRFRICKTHASVPVSEAYVLDLLGSVPRSGTVTLTTGLPGSASMKRTLSNCIIHAESEYVGKTTIHTFDVIGDEVTK